MELILNLLFAVLGFVAADYVLGQLNVPQPLRVCCALLVAILVFLANLASRL
jgi:hypothetical protein